VQCAMQPFLDAERDRATLKMMAKNRRLEDDVMKDVPGWKTGTWYGEPIFFTVGDKWWPYGNFETFVHSPEHRYDRWRLRKTCDHYAGPKWYDKYLPKVIADRVL